MAYSLNTWQACCFNVKIFDDDCLCKKWLSHVPFTCAVTVVMVCPCLDCFTLYVTVFILEDSVSFSPQ